MARALQYDEYATYGQVLLIIEIALLFISIASNQYIYVLFAKADKEGRKEIIFNGVFISLIMSIFFGLVIFFLQDYFIGLFENPKLQGNLVSFSFCAFPILLISTFEFVLFYKNQFKKAIVIRVLFNLLKVAIIVCSVQLYKGEMYKSIDIIFNWFIFLHFFIAIIYGFSISIRWFKSKLNFAIIKSFFKYGYTIGITMVIGTLIKRTDGFMISSMSEQKDYAIYRMGALEIPFLMLVFSSIITVLLPSITKLYQEKKIKEICKLKKKAISTSVIGIYPSLIFALVFAYPVLSVYFGEAYLASISVFVIYNLVLFIRVNDYRDILIAASKMRLIFILDVFVFVLNLILNYFLIKQFGVIGAVWATIISMALLSASLLAVTLKFLKVPFSAFFNFKLISITVFVSLLSSVILFRLFRIFDFIYIIPVFYFLFVIVVYFLIGKLIPSSKEVFDTLKHVVKSKNYE